MTMRITTLNSTTMQAWDAFVEQCPSATFFHRAGWKTVLERAFGHRTHYLMAEESGLIAGVLPLAELRSALFGHHLVSTPFCVYGGVATSSDEVAEALIERARSLAEELRVEDLELRNIARRDSNWPTKDLYVTFRKPITPDEDTNMKSIPRKQRAMVRKGIDAGLTGELDRSTDRFYRIYSESVRNLGTPVFSRKYFRVLQEVFDDACEISIVRHGETEIAAVMSFYFRDEVLPYYAGSIAAARDLKGNDFMYWDLMCRASRRGALVFDYGRSKVGTGPYSFKKNWGFEPTPLNYEFHLVKAKDIPKVDPTNPKYRHFIEAWKRLPLPVANGVGPLLARHLG
jgi:FemAB-related protein (PEP-CTERM system-associated)